MTILWLCHISSIFPHFPVFFSHSSSIFLHFLPHFGLPGGREGPGYATALSFNIIYNDNDNKVRIINIAFLLNLEGIGTCLSQRNE